MPENTTTQALLVDHQGDRCQINRYDDGLYITVAQDELGGPRTAGPFTAAELRAAIESAAGEADPDPHTGPSASELLAILTARTAERDGARRERDALQKALEAEQARSVGLLERARAAEQKLARCTLERDALERVKARPAEPRTEEDVTDREVEAVMRAMGWWQEGKRIGQYSVNLVRSARRAVADLANLPTQEQAEVDAIRAWLQDLDAPVTGLARELYARGFTAPGGES